MIDPWKLPPKEAAELEAMLQDVVLKRQRGHGVETFDGWILPKEARNLGDYYAADLLEVLQRKSAPGGNLGQVFRPAVMEAARTIERETGLVYQGMADTFFYYQTDGSMCQLRGALGRAIQERR